MFQAAKTTFSPFEGQLDLPTYLQAPHGEGMWGNGGKIHTFLTLA
jgi:hypothetical protein